MYAADEGARVVAWKTGQPSTQPTLFERRREAQQHTCSAEVRGPHRLAAASSPLESTSSLPGAQTAFRSGEGRLWGLQHKGLLVVGQRDLRCLPVAALASTAVQKHAVQKQTTLEAARMTEVQGGSAAVDLAADLAARAGEDRMLRFELATAGSSGYASRRDGASGTLVGPQRNSRSFSAVVGLAWAGRPLAAEGGPSEPKAAETCSMLTCESERRPAYYCSLGVQRLAVLLALPEPWAAAACSASSSASPPPWGGRTETDSHP